MPKKYKSNKKYKRKSTKRRFSKSLKKRKSITKNKCKKYLQKKISINMSEWKRGKFKSQKQALAVSYSQLKKRYPSCRRWFKK